MTEIVQSLHVAARPCRRYPFRSRRRCSRAPPFSSLLIGFARVPSVRSLQSLATSVSSTEAIGERRPDETRGRRAHRIGDPGERTCRRARRPRLAPAQIESAPLMPPRVPVVAVLVTNTSFAPVGVGIRRGRQIRRRRRVRGRGRPRSRGAGLDVAGIRQTGGGPQDVDAIHHRDVTAGVDVTRVELAIARQLRGGAEDGDSVGDGYGAVTIGITAELRRCNGGNARRDDEQRRSRPADGARSSWSANLPDASSERDRSTRSANLSLSRACERPRGRFPGPGVAALRRDRRPVRRAMATRVHAKEARCGRGPGARPPS